MIKTLSQIAMPCLIQSSYDDYCKTPFKDFKQRLSCKLYSEYRNQMIGVKLMALKFSTNVIIWPSVVENFALLMNHAWESIIREENNKNKKNITANNIVN